MVDFDSNVCLVYKVYNRKFSGFGYLCEDLIQEGMLGLWNACQAFDESRGVAFSTYATKCITRAMVDFIRKEMRHKKNQLSIDEVIDPERSSDTFEIFAGEDASKEIMKKYNKKTPIRIQPFFLFKQTIWLASGAVTIPINTFFQTILWKPIKKASFISMTLIILLSTCTIAAWLI